MAMSSTTSSAARMLLSGSMPSSDGIINPNFLARTLLPCSSNIATISASAPFPTVTLDLTQSPPPGQKQSFSGQNGVLLPQIFGQGLYNQSKFSGLQLSQDTAAGITSQIGDLSSLQLQHQEPSRTALADTVTALAANPNFTAALAVAISSIIGGGGGGGDGGSHSTSAHELRIRGEAEDYFSQSQQCKIECYKGFYVEKNAKALFMSLYKNVSNVLMERLDDTFGEKALEASGDHHEAMAVDDEDNPSMEMDKENGNSKRYTTSEKEKRCLTTLGYVKAFSRQYASFSRQYSSEIWPHMDKLEEEIVTDSVHPLLKKAVYSGLRVHIDR